MDTPPPFDCDRALLDWLRVNEKPLARIVPNHPFPPMPAMKSLAGMDSQARVSAHMLNVASLRDWQVKVAAWREKEKALDTLAGRVWPKV